MGKIGRVNPLICPAAYSVGYTECDVAAVAHAAHKERILTTVRPSSEYPLPRGILPSRIVCKHILVGAKAAAFG